MTHEEKIAYGQGYNAGSRNSWPAHRPPVPPDPVVAALMNAMRELRDAADSACATLDEEDEFVKRLGPYIDKADAAMCQVRQWLRSRPPVAAAGG